MTVIRAALRSLKKSEQIAFDNIQYSLIVAPRADQGPVGPDQGPAGPNQGHTGRHSHQRCWTTHM